MVTAASLQAIALQRLLEAAATGDRESLADLVTEDVVAWSPTLAVTSRDELLAALESRDEALTRVDVQVQAIDQIGDKAIAEWHVSADHTGPLIIDEDLLIEPTGRRLHVSGATVAEFEGDRICAFRSYFDDLALLEQALTDE